MFLTVQVEHERLELLQHPLMALYIARKWWKEAFPVLMFYILFYTIFLLFLTSFALRVPRPSPGDEFCEQLFFDVCVYLLANYVLCDNRSEQQFKRWLHST